MQTDPIGYADGMNWYNYVYGDPVNGRDPTGTQCWDTGYNSVHSVYHNSTGYGPDGQAVQLAPQYDPSESSSAPIQNCDGNDGIPFDQMGSQYIKVQSFSLGVLPEEFGSFGELGKALGGFKTLAELFKDGRIPTKAELTDFAKAQDWKELPQGTGPLKFVDENGIVRMTIKEGSARTPGSEQPHAEFRMPKGRE